MKNWYVYIFNKQGVLYLGVTTNINHRMTQHKAELLYSEEHDSKLEAAKREKQVRRWARRRKIELVTGKSLG